MEWPRPPAPQGRPAPIPSEAMTPGTVSLGGRAWSWDARDLGTGPRVQPGCPSHAPRAGPRGRPGPRQQDRSDWTELPTSMGGPTPLARDAGGGSPRILLGLRMMQGRGTSRSPSSLELAEWGRGRLQQEALLGQRTMAPSLRAWAPPPGLRLEREGGAAAPFCARFRGNSGFRPFCIFESESIYSTVTLGASPLAQR